MNLLLIKELTNTWDSWSFFSLKSNPYEEESKIKKNKSKMSEDQAWLLSNLTGADPKWILFDHFY